MIPSWIRGIFVSCFSGGEASQGVVNHTTKAFPSFPSCRHFRSEVGKYGVRVLRRRFAPEVRWPASPRPHHKIWGREIPGWWIIIICQDALGVKTLCFLELDHLVHYFGGKSENNRFELAGWHGSFSKCRGTTGKTYLENQLDLLFCQPGDKVGW